MGGGGDTAVMRGDIELMGGPPSPPPLEKTLRSVVMINIFIRNL